MDSSRPTLRILVEQAQGRCHSCIHSNGFDIPSGTRWWCRAFAAEISEEQHRAIRQCPRWRAFMLQETRPPVIANPLLQEVIEVEDLMFWRLKYHLEELGLDLRTTITLAHPSLDPQEDLAWIDSLDLRFNDCDPVIFSQVLAQLRALGYFSLAAMVERTMTSKDGAGERSA